MTNHITRITEHLTAESGSSRRRFNLLVRQGRVRRRGTSQRSKSDERGGRRRRDTGQPEPAGLLWLPESSLPDARLPERYLRGCQLGV